MHVRRKEQVHVQTEVVAVQLTRQHVVDVLRTAGLPEMADEAVRDLPTRLTASRWRRGPCRTVSTWVSWSAGWAAARDVVRDPAVPVPGISSRRAP